MLELLLYPIYFAIYLPIVLYPIPYINTKIIKQKLFIDICEYRMATLLTTVTIYNYFNKSNFFSDDLFYIFVGNILICVGQLLNLSVYFRLGRKGVYYGLQYRTVQYRKLENTFPFYISHPQYLGGVLSYIGSYLLIAFEGGIFDPMLTVLLINIMIVQLYLVAMETTFDKIYKK